jgi:fumarylpyruvate hydrolase
MTAFVIDPPARPVVPVEGDTAVFPVRRIYCVGQNYAAHKAEMGNGDDRTPPFFFSKPGDTVVPPGGDAPYPTVTQNFHHEIELVVAIGKAGANVPVEQALDLVFGYATGVDLTRRDLQLEYKAKGRPWDASKGFDASAPISPIRRWTGAPPQGAIRVAVNGQMKQDSKLDDMIWNVAEIVSEASKLWRLEPGDLIFTGTPEGVGPLVRGDQVDGEIEGVGKLSFKIV